MHRRKLKKESSKHKIKVLFVILLFLTAIVIAAEYLYINFSFGRAAFISPIAKENKSKLASLENVLDSNKIFYNSVNLGIDGSFVIDLKTGGEVILSSKKDLGSQLTSLQLILSRLTIEGKKLNKLDFRFDNPVVEY